MPSAIEVVTPAEFLGEDVFGNANPDGSPKAVDGRKSVPSSPDRVLRAPTKSVFKLRELNGELAPEPLLLANPHRFVLFPIQHKDVRASLCKNKF
jgi:hypothetical protein